MANNVISAQAWQKPYEKPDINWRHPLADGLVAAFVPSPYGGQVIDHVTGALQDVISPDWGSTHEGYGVTNVEGAASVSADANLTSNYTFGGRFWLPWGMHSTNVFGRWDTGGWLIYFSSNLRRVVFVTLSGAGWSGDYLWNNPDTNSINSRAIDVYASSDGSNKRLYLESDHIGTKSIGAVCNSNTTRGFRFQTSNTPCYTYHGYVWRRVLLAQEIKELKYNPYGFLKRRQFTTIYHLGTTSGGETTVTVDVPAATLTLTANVPTVTASGNQAVSVPAASLTLTANVPTVTASDNQTIAVPAASLSVSAQVPTVTATDAQVVSVPLAQLSLTSYVPTVTATNNQTIQVPLATLSLAAQPPTVTATGNQLVVIPLVSLSLAPAVPTVATTNNQSVSVPSTSLSLTAQVPTVVTSGTVAVSVPAVGLTLTTNVPTITATTNNVSVPTASLSLTTNVPTVATTSHQTVSVPLASLSLTTAVPTISVSDNQAISVPAASLSLTTAAPTIALSANISLPAASLTLTALAPSITAGDPATVTINVTASLSLTTYVPSIYAVVVCASWTDTSDPTSTWTTLPPYDGSCD